MKKHYCSNKVKGWTRHEKESKGSDPELDQSTQLNLLCLPKSKCDPQWAQAEMNSSDAGAHAGQETEEGSHAYLPNWQAG